MEETIYSNSPVINHLTIEDNTGAQYVVGADWGSTSMTYTPTWAVYQDAQIDEDYVRRLAREEAKKMIQEMLDSGEIVRRTDVTPAEQRRIQV